jgi:DNA-directed RNA polymerase specialized sigma24 family protein
MTPENFEEMLLWLDPDPDGTGVPDRERGAEKYEKISRRIVKIYRNRGSHRAEEIADEAMSRVCAKVAKLRLTYEGDPALYFYAVAKRVWLEFMGGEGRTPPPLPPKDDPEMVERRHACLDQCLETLKPESRELILCFYEGEKRVKIDNRKRIAARLGIDSKALSLRAMRIRRELLDCMLTCLGG